MVDIFPFVDFDEEMIEDLEVEELAMAQEYAWDFKEKDFKLKNGKMYLVEGDQAVKIWLWKLFKTPRFRYLIYDWNYGHEFEELIGHGYTQNYLNAEVVGHIKEAIEYNLGDYVVEIKNVKVVFKDSHLTIDMTVNTPYGEVEMIV